jgi:hypothetical protein
MPTHLEGTPTNQSLDHSFAPGRFLLLIHSFFVRSKLILLLPSNETYVGINIYYIYYIYEGILNFIRVCHF